MSTEDIHARVGAFVVDALPDDERDEFEQHLRGCVTCRHEVRSLTEAASRLGEAAAEPVPPGVRDRVMSRVATVRQLPPPVPNARPRRRWLPQATAVAAAACLVVALVLGAFLVQSRNRVEQLEAQQRRIESVLGAPDVEVTKGARTSYGTGTLTVSRERDRAVFTLDDPKALPRDRTYQLWFLAADGTARSAGVLPRRDTGTTVVADPLRDARQVGLTVEPEGGSRQPTTTPVMLLAVP